jgi:hypothetical protein
LLRARLGDGGCGECDDSQQCAEWGENCHQELDYSACALTMQRADLL